MKLTIAMVNDGVTDFTAGSFVSTRRFAQMLASRGHKVIFIAARSEQHPVDDYYQDIRVYRFRSVPLPKTQKQLYLAFPKESDLKKIFKEEVVDIVHVMLPTFSAPPAIRAAKSLGIPVVAHSHMQPENLSLHLPRFLPIARIDRAFYSYLHWLYSKADAVIFPSTFSQRQFPKLATKRQLVISNGVNTEIFRPVNPAPFFEKFHLDQKNKHLLFLGRLEPEKSVDTLIRALPHILKNVRNAHCIIAGDGSLRAELERLAAKLGVASQVTFCGKLSDEELPLAYSACDLFASPSLAELEGMTVLEAMACGKPILIADSKDSAAAYFVEGNGLLFRTRSPEYLATQATLLLTDKSFLAACAQQSLTNSRRYDINESVTQLESLYQALVTRS